MVKDPDGGSFLLPVKELYAPPPDVVEYAHHGEVLKFAAPKQPYVEITTECTYVSVAFNRILDWHRALSVVGDHKRDGALVFCEPGGKVLAERSVCGMWPSSIAADPSTRTLTTVLVCDLVGAEQPAGSITFAEGVSEEQKAKIEAALTPKGLATLARYGVAVVED
jgi:hypothetical protein